MSELKVLIRRLPHAEGLALPAYGTEHAAAVDFAAAVNADVVINPRERALIPTGFCVGIPEGYEMQVRPRSGLALKHGITTLNGPGTIDADYRGEVHVILINHGQEPFVVQRGMRIAQMVIAPCQRVGWSEVESLDDTVRGQGGFGSTGS